MRLSVIKKCICYITAVSVTVMLAAPVVSYGTAEDDVKLSNADLGYVEGEVLVTFKEDVSEKEAVEIAQDVTDCEATVLETPQAESTTVLAKTDEDKDVEKLVKKYEKDREVAYAQPNYLYRIETEDDNDQPSIADDIKTSFNDPLYSQQWYIDKIDADDAWKLISEKYRGKEKVKVAVLDLGTKLDHKDLKDAMLTGNCVEVPKAAPGDKPDLSLEVELKPYSTPRGYHGTLVGGVIAAVPNNGEGIVGVANGLAELMSIAVFRYREGQADSQKLAASEDVVAGINYAVKNGAKVINMSFGHGLGSQSATNDQLLEDTINKVTKEDNVTIVCSAGNNDNTGLWLPSDFDATISVISTDNYSSAFDNSRSSFSSYGKDKTLSAPGKKIITTNTQGRYESPSGTSMAAPVVASVAAMMYYVNPDIKANDVKRILCDTATDLYETGWDDQTGYGNVNAYAAVAKAAGLEVDNKPARLTPPTITSVASAGLGRLTVKWTPVADAEGYYLYRSTSPNGTYSYVGAVREKGKTSYTNGSRKLNSRYYYKVKAFGTVDNKKTFSDYSNYGAGAATGKISGISAKAQLIAV